MSMRKIVVDRVTVTGADDSVEPHQVLDLCRKYPIAEIGVLFGSHTGPRFPTPEWVGTLLALAADCSPPVRLAAHLCASYVRSFLGSDVKSSFAVQWGRLQVNTHAEPHGAFLTYLRRKIEALTMSGRQVIFQMDGVNDDLFHWAQGCLKLLHKSVHEPDVAALFDKSHGEGRLPAEWPRGIPGTYCGYAGGLSPENVRGELDKIEDIHSCGEHEPTKIWVDAETRLRSSDGMVFDLAKAASFIEEASRWASVG